jgi:putative sterol carrier protein
MPGVFNRNAAAGLDAVFQYNIEGADGGDWYVVVKNQTCSVSEGVHANPTVSLRLADKDWIAICNGELDSMSAFMSGKLKITGDIMLAQRITSLFPLG